MNLYRKLNFKTIRNAWTVSRVYAAHDILKEDIPREFWAEGNELPPGTYKKIPKCGDFEGGYAIWIGCRKAYDYTRRTWNYFHQQMIELEQQLSSLGYG